MDLESPDLFRRCCAEATGTFFLVLIGAGAAVVNAATGVVTHVGVALATGLVVMTMIYALGHISGAHINPAVTLAFASQRLFPRGDVLPYLTSQAIGATAAALSLRAAFPNFIAAAATVPHFGTTTALGTEFLLSFGLMLVIMAFATDSRAQSGVAGLAIGLTVAFEAMAGGPVTGASMNPARSFGPALAGSVWRAHWVYWAAPVAGMLAAGSFYQWLRGARWPARESLVGTKGPVSRGRIAD